MSDKVAFSPLENQKSSFSWWLAWEICCNILLALFFAQFVILNGRDLLDGFRLSSLLMLMKVSADTIFHLFRRPARSVTIHPYDWFIGIAGAYTVFFFRHVDGTDHLAGTVIQCFGIGLQVYAMISLNRSIGFVPANRGIKTKGMYRFVRHPLYFAYIVAFLGFVLNHFTTRNLCVYGIMITCLLLRAIAEERLLMKSDEYKEYAKKVRWRIIPYVI